MLHAVILNSTYQSMEACFCICVEILLQLPEDFCVEPFWTSSDILVLNQWFIEVHRAFLYIWGRITLKLPEATSRETLSAQDYQLAVIPSLLRNIQAMEGDKER